MALSPEDRAWYKQRYRAETPSTEAPPVAEGDDAEEDEEDEDEDEEDNDDEDQNEKVSFLSLFIQLTFILSVAVRQ